MHPALVVDRANTVLYCRRWTETVQFYRDTLGLAAVSTNDWFVEFEISPGSFVSIADESRATITTADGRGVTLAWRIGDADAAWALLVERGVEVTAITHRWGSPVFYCHDPEGHRIEFWSAPAAHQPR